MSEKLSGGVFPEELNFLRHPQKLQFAIDALPEIKGRRRRSKTQLLALKKKLLQMSVNDLTKLKMKSQMAKVLKTCLKYITLKLLTLKTIILKMRINLS